MEVAVKEKVRIENSNRGSARHRALRQSNPRRFAEQFQGLFGRRYEIIATQSETVQPADEKTLTANPLQARGPPSRDFAIRGVQRHVTTIHVSARHRGKASFRPHRPYRSCNSGRIGICPSDVERSLTAENWSSNKGIAPWKFG
ncbi:hypothetical protein RvY_16458 [Ramazzottius varieornatus]|uniref:Uncharacterized protein n=1 Tax=Ramazzottius varieornatus TaxID=947166 RepID=A0A1D1W4X5_RAMVA|nr:hypothetical protein RvY_16458 [Ramazzottius varieornatus]